MNKKTLLTSLLLLCVTIVTYAQDNTPTHISVPSKNEYLLKDPLWYVSVGIGAQTIFGTDDHKVSFHRRLTWAPTVTVGRRFGNLLGVRLQLFGGSLHGFNDGDAGYYEKWTKEKYFFPRLITFDPQWDYMGWELGKQYVFEFDPGSDSYVYRAAWGENGGFYMQHIRYIALAGDVTLNLFNLIEGYKPNRKFELIPFGGLVGLQRFAHWGTLASPFIGVSLGLNGTYSINRKFGVFGEFRGILVQNQFDGQIGDMVVNGIGSATAGVTYRFGEPKYIDPVIETRLNLPYNIARANDGTVLVPGGNVEMVLRNSATGDSVGVRDVAVSPFWMDETEVTNAQYREFVYWVRDSIIRERLADPAYGGDPTYKVLVRPKYEGGPVGFRLNWMKPIPWKNPTARESNAIASVMGNSNWFAAEKSGLDVSLLDYRYDKLDTRKYYAFLTKVEKEGPQSMEISKDTAYLDYKGNIVRETLTRTTYGDPIDFTSTYILNVYPDVLAWMTDFSNAKNEQYAKNYFTSSMFDRFPVVGVSWEQADSYCAWRTDRFKAENLGRLSGFEIYRLPTEAEWMFAAKNGRSEMMYPWFSNETHTSDGLAHSNFIQSRDLKDLISPVATFLPNRFGLYDMAGNVSEWTSTSFIESLDKQTQEANPDFSYRAVLSDPMELKRKVVKGGSWKDTAQNITANARSVEYQNKGRSYIGFRCVRSWGIDEKGRLR